MTRREFPRAVRVAALKRCQDAQGILRCEECGVALKAGAFAFDHVTADSLGGAPTLDNCMVLCAGAGSCHARKTAEHDVPAIARAKRREARHLGVQNAPSRPIRSPGFRPAPPRNTASRPIEKWAAWRSKDNVQ